MTSTDKAGNTTEATLDVTIQGAPAVTRQTTVNGKVAKAFKTFKKMTVLLTETQGENQDTRLIPLSALQHYALSPTTSTTSE